MAERRMFNKQITRSDAFLDMPRSTRLLYYDLSLDADDDGFIGKHKSIMRLTGASEDDIKLLIAKSFIIPFENGVIVIKHWRMNNLIRCDRYKPTVYQDEKKQLQLKENGSYTKKTTIGIPNDNQCVPQYSIGKDSIVKESIEEKELDAPLPPPSQTDSIKRFVKPTLAEVQAYCSSRKNNIDAQHFIDFYTSKGWKVGNQPMKDWKAAVRTWEGRRKEEAKSISTKVADGSKYARED